MAVGWVWVQRLWQLKAASGMGAWHSQCPAMRVQACGAASAGRSMFDAVRVWWHRAQPVRFSHFYGQTDVVGAPVLAPGRSADMAGGPAGGQATRGCAEACVGDVVTVEVDVVSRLPEALPIAGACLRLALLQARQPLRAPKLVLFFLI